MATETESARRRADHGGSEQRDGSADARGGARKATARGPRRLRPGGTDKGADDGGTGARLRGGHLIGTYGLLGLTVLLFVIFALALPDTFPTMENASSILSNQSIPAILALGAMIPIVTGKFDLSVGYGLGLAHVLAMQLIVNNGWPWPMACLVVILGGGLIGVFNGLLVEFAKIDSFIATLGTGSVLYACTGWITDGARIVPGPQGLPPAFTDLYNSKFLGLPVPAFYVLALAVLLWLLLERLPLGRYLYVIGSNARAADLVGIPTRRYGIYAFAGSGLVVGFAGVLLAAQQTIGNPSVGMDYLLPAFVGALLGSTAIKPGRANAAGTVVAVTILAIGLAGIGQLGAEFWATPLFNGGTLLLAVGLAGYSARRRLRAGATATRRSPSTPVPEAATAQPTPAATGSSDGDTPGPS
ncbi:ABC transporter permease [Streptomyces turgidiscabies]|uniref:Amino acid or sugar ABC transporter, permease protein n=1 Tax=Streptomyces turgidiscabies (strain Car8) TaxID=698760 RepID=L7ESK4_STRT8|nr:MULTISPECIES: ABC transporter permease [Streptomyces]ELP61987.1 amino acid or sugar ABC transporter, permease protein [Streptomyces turgidiscabies Car8]MDX3499917.1 ABC transporter permease [Streptomyces turgidiscabies]GAQ76956.1 D-allose transport system permease protein AlsC [Streptomyces turgidiscabies]